MKNTRAAFILASVITVILLAGSVLLQRIVFEAAESSSSVYTSPSNFIVKPNGQVKLDLISDFSLPAFVVGGQFVFEYSSDRLDFVEGIVSDNFETKKLTVVEDRIYWVVTPNPKLGLVEEFNDQITIGQLVFSSKSLGSANVSMVPEQTSIYAIDPEGSTTLYNAVSSVQGSLGDVTDKTEIVSVGAQLEDVDISKPSSSGIQKLTRNVAVPLAGASLQIIELNDLGLVSIDYGKTDRLGGTVRSTATSKSQTIMINGLEANTLYYYKVKALSSDGELIFSDPIKTFTTKQLSTKTEVKTVELFAGSRVASKELSIFALSKDVDGKIINNPNIELKITKGSATISKKSGSELLEFKTTALSNSKQEVTVAALVDGVIISELSVNFDPELVEEINTKKTISETSFNITAQLTLAALLLVVILAGLALSRLLRVK